MKKLTSFLRICAVVVLVASAACEREPLDVATVTDLATATLKSETFPVGDATEYYEAALAFRASVDDWRAGKLSSRSGFTGEQLSDELSNTYNMLWGNPTRTYTRQEVILDSVAVAPGAVNFGAEASLAAYEGVKTIIEGALVKYDADSAGFRFVYVSPPKQKVTGTYLDVYAQVGDYGATPLGGRSLGQFWGSPSIEPNPGCESDVQNFKYIESQVNIGLGRRITANSNGSGTGNTDGKNNTRTIIDGAAYVSFITSPRPGIADPADLVVPLQRFARTNGPLYANTVDVQPGTFPDAGQFLVHLSQDGDELCFNSTKSQQYVTDHNMLGDGILRTEWRAHTGFTGPEYVRVGAFMSCGRSQVFGGGLDYRDHFAKFFYGRIVAISIDLPGTVEP